MLIFSKNRKKFAECVSASIERNFGGGKDGKYALVCSAGFGTSTDCVFATYSDEKTAMDELEKIFAAFESGAKSYRL